jgi:UDP:flavonoid glycosyltransferase YjiC (YdhE family)
MSARQRLSTEGSMRVAVVVSGSRGDVQPMLALAIGLETAGHDAVFCSSPDNGEWVRRLGCAFEAIGEPLRDNASLGGWGFGAFNRFIRRQIDLQIRQLPRILHGCDLVIASGLVWGVRPVAERLGIPYRYVAFIPADFLGTTRDPVSVRLVRGLADRYADLAYGPALRRGRADLGLPRADNVMRQLMGPGTIAATDPALTTLPDGGRLRAPQTGYPILAQDGGLSGPVHRFLAAGPPPIYAGFGSMPMSDRARIGRLLVEAAERVPTRLIMARGWAGITPSGPADRTLLVDDVPHSLLFPRVTAVIHHGGAGTIATAARAGVPQIVLPVAADQLLWRDRIVRLGLGARAPMLRMASASSVAKAITATLADPSFQRRASQIAARLRAAPDGVTTTVAEITRPGVATA